jgi:dTMP kinase
MPSPRPLFIAFEGIDGSGKSTQVRLLAEHWQSRGRRVHQTCEPTAGPIGGLIRESFSHRRHFDDRVIAGLFVADRLHHLLEEEEGILARLERGFDVISDRYYLSSYAYQGAHMPMDWVIGANALSAGLRKPDLHIYVDLAPERSMERLLLSRPSLERYETLHNLEAVHRQYRLAMAAVADRETFFLVDGDQSPEAIAREIRQELDQRFFLP